MPKIPALPYVRGGVTNGLSANAAFREYQTAARELTAETGEPWQASRRQDFLRLYSQTVALRGTAAQALRAPKGSLPDPALVIDRDTARARGYGTWVLVAQRTIGESDFLTTPFLVKTPQPITPQEAEAQALQWLDQEPDTYNRRTLGVTYIGTEHFQPGQ